MDGTNWMGIIVMGQYLLVRRNNLDSKMEKTISTSNYDVIVVRHRNKTFKSTPFQAVFSERAMKARESKKNKLKELQLLVNDQLVDLPMRIDPNNGRVHFQKKYIRKTGHISDGSDMSDDDRSHRSTSHEKRLSGSNLKGETIQQLKNQQAPPKNFWQFAWLFSKKTEPTVKEKEEKEEKEEEEPKLARIKEEPYQGEESSSEPLFQLSLCGQLLAKKKEKQATKQESERIFYANKVEYKDFIKNPLAIINDANLVVRIDNSIYTWQLGVAVLACRFAFGVEPEADFVDSIIKAKTKKSWFPSFDRSSVTKLDIDKEPPLIQPPSKPDEQEIIRYRRAPDSEMLSKMKLRPGENKAKFTLQTAPGVCQQTEFRIYLWDENEKVVISDIDGTITKSDVMGQLKTNYIHKGVCLLYNEIYKRNYKILYMTARAINQYTQTRKFLVSQVVENGMKLPPGPLLMSPDGYLKSFTRQVIQKTPDQLKIKLLASINQIFPNTKKPIMTGFGNRQTDSIAYLRIKIPPERIFCISQKSIITNQSDKDFSTTYLDMLDKIDDYFPLYVKPEDSQALSIPEPNSIGKILPSEENLEEELITHRKMSHYEFYERSPNQISDKKEFFSSATRTKSEEGEPFDKDFDFEPIKGQLDPKEGDKDKKKSA